jgi:hypothetical protein
VYQCTLCYLWGKNENEKGKYQRKKKGSKKNFNRSKGKYEWLKRREDEIKMSHSTVNMLFNLFI